MDELINILKENIRFNGFNCNLVRKIYELDRDCTHLLNIIFTNNLDLSVRCAAVNILQLYYDKYKNETDNYTKIKHIVKLKIVQEIVDTEEELKTLLSKFMNRLIQQFMFAILEISDTEVRNYFNCNDQENWLKGYFLLKNMPNGIVLTFVEEIQNQMKLVLWCYSQGSLDIQIEILNIISDAFKNRDIQTVFPKKKIFFWIETTLLIIKRPQTSIEKDFNNKEIKCKLNAIHLLKLVIKICFQQNKFWMDKSCGEKIFTTVMDLFKKCEGGWKANNQILFEATQIFITLMNKESETRHLMKYHLSTILKDVIFSYPYPQNRFDSEYLLQTIFDEEPNETITFIISVLNSPHAKENQKGSAIHMMGTIIYHVLQRSTLIGFNFESFIHQHLFPVEQFKDSELRSEIFYFINEAVENEELGEKIVILFLDQIISSVKEDTEFDVREKAFDALITLICNYGNKIKDQIIAKIETIVAHLIIFMKNPNFILPQYLIKEIMDNWSNGKDSILRSFIEQLPDFYYHRVLKKCSNTDSIHSMNYISWQCRYVLQKKKDKQVIFLSIQKAIYDICLLIIRHSIQCYHKGIDDILSDFIDDSIIENILTQIYPQQYLIEAGVYNKSHTNPSLQKPIIENKSCNNIDPSIIKLINEMCKKITQRFHQDELLEVNIIQFFKIVLLYHGSESDEYISQIVDSIGQRMHMEIKSDLLKHSCATVIATALYVNRELTFSHLINKQWLGSKECILDIFIHILCDDSCMPDSFNKLQILGLSTVLSIRKDSPQNISMETSNLLFQILSKKMESYYDKQML